MSEDLERFKDRLESEWLPAFCDSRTHLNYSKEGFRWESVERLTEFDAHWFLRATDSAAVTHHAGFFRAPQSKANEQLFWSGAKDKVPRLLTLWIEPVITIGAVARLHEEFAWPLRYIGMQSSGGWAFDVVGYSEDLKQELLVVEVKKTDAEIATLIALMCGYGENTPLPFEPSRSVEKNAYRKVQHIRARSPVMLWALGPNGNGKAFCLARSSSSRIQLLPVGNSHLIYSAMIMH